MSNKKHMDLSPSQANRWWNCPGSIELCKKAPKMPDSEYAKEGTVAHEVLSRSLSNKLNPYDLVGIEIDGLEVTEEMADGASMAIDVVQEELARGGELMVETLVDYIPGKVGGRLDIAILRHFDRIIVADYKFGQGVAVSPVDNHQLLIYLLALLTKYECEHGELIIIQPRARGEAVSRWSCDREYLKTYEEELKRHIALTEETNAPLLAGSWCRWCAAKVNCPEVRKDLATALAPVQNKEIVFPNVAALSIPQITKVLDYSDRIEDWMHSVWAYAQTILENGGTVPGYFLKKKEARRRWKHEPDVIAKYSGEFDDALYAVKLVSPAALEKLLGKDRKKEVSELTEIPDKGSVITKDGKK
jgi:hypothetical protein